MSDVINKAFSGERLNLEQGVSLFDEDLLSIGMIADQRMKKYHPENIVTFIIDRNITFTNVCVLGCRFCAFSVKPDSKDAYLLSKEEIFLKIEKLIEIGGTQVMLQGGIHPELSLDYYCSLLQEI
ncbi:MAG: radical SAM protein, partial [bacterium]|nr:radical SAM protein [bacterium]